MNLHDRFLATRLRTVLVFGLSCVGVPAPSSAGPLFVGLGDLPGGGVTSEGAAVSEDGTTVVGRSLSSRGSEAYFWTATTGMRGIGDLPGGNTNSIALDVSRDGSVIVGFSSSVPGNQAFRWTATSGMVGLGDLDGSAFFSMATGVSGDGSVVSGVGSRATFSDREAFRWTEGSGLTGLGILVRPLSTLVDNIAVSSNGSTVVGTVQGGEPPEAFRWTRSSGLEELGHLPGGVSNNARNISPDGRTIVGRDFIPSDGGSHAFRWTAESGMEDIGSFFPRGVSNNGEWIVGTTALQNPQRAILWDELHGERDLKILLESEFGLDLTDWTLLMANDISADGTTIIGTGLNPYGDVEAWIAVIPEPDSYVLFGLVLIGVLLLTKRLAVVLE